MLKSLKFKNLSGKWSHTLHFYPDVNVLTGRNGSGKTTILKLLWYLVSGNLDRIVSEIRFDSLELEADDLKLRLEVSNWDAVPLVSVQYDVGGGWTRNGFASKEIFGEREKINRINEAVAKASGRSVFFPTFRRIEGGFTIDNRQPSLRQPSLRARRGGSLQAAMVELSDKLSTEHHQFISSISTDDIDALLTQQYSDVSREANVLQGILSDHIEKTIQGFNEQDAPNLQDSLDEARALLKSIQTKVQETSDKRARLFAPFDTLEVLLSELLQYKGISFREIKTFGDVAAAIDANFLSSGEKQMLSFLCYNAFNRQAMIFIDEPETSLHVDWQRILFPKLMAQSSDNQFFIATHSPFIYTKYADKELVINPDHGDTNA